MNEKQRQIEADIKRQMIALSAQMDALNKWKATGYNSEICIPALHDWHIFEQGYDDFNTWHCNSTCSVCGLNVRREYAQSSENHHDAYTDFREGGEEE